LANLSFGFTSCESSRVKASTDFCMTDSYDKKPRSALFFRKRTAFLGENNETSLP
jgi:hypothetical protein